MLSIRNLKIEFHTPRGVLRAVDGLDLTLAAGQSLGLVGESGCGKSLTSLALMGLLPETARWSADEMLVGGQDLRGLSDADWRSLRSGTLSMVFQSPMSSLNPCFTVGDQVGEALGVHERSSRKATASRVEALFQQVGIPDPARRMSAYPHQLSGGMCQRVMIAMAIASRPKLLIADEPTTALDVTIQAQIMELIQGIQKETGMAMLFISHDISLVSQVVDRIAVMYAGRVVEEGPVERLVQSPRHRYTEGLLACLPGGVEMLGPREILPAIPGVVPDLIHRPSGCSFHPRCARADDRCATLEPLWMGLPDDAGGMRCFYPAAEVRPDAS